MTKALAEQVALVTGAGRGIGHATAVELARSGATVVMSARNREEIEAGAALVHEEGGEALAITADVSDPESISALVQETVDRLGRLDILVTCAAAEPAAGPTETLSTETWQRVIDVDLTGAFVACREGGRVMLERGYGRIVNLASFHVVATYPQRAAYVAAKAGVVGLTQALAVEWGGRGITVNAIAPGPVRTDRTAWFISQDSLAAEGMVARTPTGRIAEPEEIAGAVRFLCSAEARHITGQTLVIDGGWTRNAWWGKHPWTPEKT